MSATRYGTQGISGFCPIHEWDVSECDIACHRLRPAFKRAGEAFRKYWYDRKCGVRPIRESRSINIQLAHAALAEKRRKAA